MKVSEALGEIVWLMSQSPLHKGFFISDLEWMIMTPVLLGQFRLFHGPAPQQPLPAQVATTIAPSTGTQTQQPMGVVLWGLVSEEVAERLKQGVPKLRPQDWRSGDRLWVVEVIAPFGGAGAMLQDFKRQVFPDRLVSFVKLGVKGKEVGVV